MHIKDWLESHVREYLENGWYTLFNTSMLDNGEVAYTLMGEKDIIKVVTQGATESEMLGCKTTVVFRVNVSGNDNFLFVANRVANLKIVFKNTIFRASDGNVSIEINDTIPTIQAQDEWTKMHFEKCIEELFWDYMHEYGFKKVDLFKYKWLIIDEDNIQEIQEWVYEECARITNNYDVAVDFIDKLMVANVLGSETAEQLWNSGGTESFNYHIFEKMRENRTAIIMQASTQSENM